MDEVIKQWAEEGELVVYHCTNFKGGLIKSYWCAYPNRHKDGTWDLCGRTWTNRSEVGMNRILKKLDKILIMTDDAARLNRDLEDFKIRIEKENIKKIPTAYEWFNSWIKNFKKNHK